MAPLRLPLPTTPEAPGPKELRDCGPCPKAGRTPTQGPASITWDEAVRAVVPWEGGLPRRAGVSWSELAAAWGSVALIRPACTRGLGTLVSAALGDGSHFCEAPHSPLRCQGSQAWPGVHIRPIGYTQTPQAGVREARPSPEGFPWKSGCPAPPSPCHAVVAGRGSAPASQPPWPVLLRGAQHSLTPCASRWAWGGPRAF